MERVFPYGTFIKKCDYQPRKETKVLSPNHLRRLLKQLK